MNVYGFVGNDGVNWSDYLGLDFWIEENNPTEPAGHISLCVGKPEHGKYVCFSYGVDFGECCDLESISRASLKGGVYEEDKTDHGGRIRKGSYYLAPGGRTDRRILDALDDMMNDVGGKKYSPNYNPLNTCIEWTKEAHEKIVAQLSDRVKQMDPPFDRVPNPGAEKPTERRRVSNSVSEPSKPSTERPSSRVTTSSGGATTTVEGEMTGLSSTTAAGGATTTGAQSTNSTKGSNRE